MKGLSLKSLFTNIAVLLALNACSISPSQKNAIRNTVYSRTDNTTRCRQSFFYPYNTVYQIPDVANITAEDYLLAFEAGIIQLQQQIMVIAYNQQDPTFENTIEVCYIWYCGHTEKTHSNTLPHS
jgi:peptidyl-dipeptidase Dcp